jgi:nucleotide-binding universal stress UspA family protein
VIAQHILVPMDFSTPSDQAFNYALELAGRLQARITLVHVIQLPALGAPVAGSLPVSYLHDLEVKTAELMESYAQRVREAGLECDTAIVQGVPSQQITDLAHTSGVDLIVMGTHGRTGLQHLLMGSVAEKVVRMAPCSVLVTRRSSPASEQ